MENNQTNMNPITQSVIAELSAKALELRQKHQNTDLAVLKEAMEAAACIVVADNIRQLRTIRDELEVMHDKSNRGTLRG